LLIIEDAAEIEEIFEELNGLEINAATTRRATNHARENMKKALQSAPRNFKLYNA
jgi:hypothetical protein